MPENDVPRRTFLRGVTAVTALSYSRVHGANERVQLGLVGCVQPVVGPSRHAPDDENTDEDEDNAAQSDAFTQIRNRSSKNARCYQETGEGPVKPR